MSRALRVAEVVIAVVLAFCCAPSAHAAAGDPMDDGEAELFPAFPGAEGAGAYTPGGRGGKLLFVTTLADYDPAHEKPIAGSLRWALDTRGPRTILFRVGGTIELKRNLGIKEPFLTIAGQSAPGGGICLKNCNLKLDTHDVVLRHLRIRPGDVQERELDAISCTARNVIIDHCSTSWAIDEVLSTNGNSARVTVQWCMITESLNHSFHHKGSHGYGSLISGPGEITYHHNVYAYHRSRNPRGGDGLLDFRNNLIYGWGDRPGYSGNDLLRLNYVGNYLQPLAYSKSSKYAFLPGGLRPRIFISENRMQGAEDRDRDNWLLVRAPKGAGAAEAKAQIRVAHAFPSSEVATESADEARAHILQQVGATLPLRDAVDARVIAQIRAAGGRLIDSQAEVGGWPQLAAGSPLPDRDGDGMPDEWEQAHGLDPARSASLAQDTDGDGYTDVEEFLNGTDPQKKEPWIAPPTVRSSMGPSFVGSTQVTLAAKTPGAEIRYTLDDALPERNSLLYTGPFELPRSATVRARAFIGAGHSPVRNVNTRRLEPLQPVLADAGRPGLRFNYYEKESWKGFPDFASLESIAEGVVPEVSLAPRKREGEFGLRLTGLFRAPREGIYRFHLRCSPRAQLLVHDQVVVESQGRKREHAGAVALKAGFHPLTFQIYYPTDDNKILELSCEGPGLSRGPLGAELLSHLPASDGK